MTRREVYGPTMAGGWTELTPPIDVGQGLELSHEADIDATISAWEARQDDLDAGAPAAGELPLPEMAAQPPVSARDRQMFINHLRAKHPELYAVGGSYSAADEVRGTAYATVGGDGFNPDGTQVGHRHEPMRRLAWQDRVGMPGEDPVQEWNRTTGYQGSPELADARHFSDRFRDQYGSF